MKKTNTTMKKTIAIMMIIATLVGLVLLLLTGCGGEAKKGGEDVKLQATGSSEAKPSEGESGAAGSESPTSEAAESTEDLSEGSEATEGSSSAPTEASTKSTTAATENSTSAVTEPPHQHSYTATLVAPTCNDKGYTLHSCSCGHSYKDAYTAALGHHFVDEVVAPTSTEKGYTKHTCDRCWYSYNDTYTNPVKVIYDIEQAMAIGNARAAELGFHVDYSLTPDHAAYYPSGLLDGELIAECGGQAYLNSRMIEKVEATASHLGNDVPSCSGRAYITYDESTGLYVLYFLY